METIRKVRRKAIKIVTKDYLRDRLNKPDGNQVLGRALLRIYERQTLDEICSNETVEKNNQGFTMFDAKLGTIAAVAFKTRGVVPKHLAAVWMRPDKTGYPRICRYVRQLNEVAVAKQNLTHEATH